MESIHFFLSIMHTHTRTHDSDRQEARIILRQLDARAGNPPQTYRSWQTITRSLERGQTDRQTGRLTGDTLTR